MISIVVFLKVIQEKLVSNDKMNNNYMINPYDLKALNSILELKKNTELKVTGIVMGPKGCMDTVKKCKAYGVDEMYLISDPVFAGSDTFATSYILYQALKYIGDFDIVVFGEKSIDGETGQVPVGVASRLGIICIGGVEQIKINDKDHVYIKRIYSGQLEELLVACPLSISFHDFCMDEPIVSLIKLKQARKYEPLCLDNEVLHINTLCCGERGSKTKVANAMNMLRGRENKVISGSIEQKAEFLQSFLLKEGI